MPAILVNYNCRPEWLLTSGLDYTLYDRSDDGYNHLEGFPPERIIKTTNRGNVDYDKLSFLVDFYDRLPPVFLWGKSNLFKYITREEFDALPKDGFTPLLTQNHRTYSDQFGAVNYYSGGMYYERNDGWYLHEQPAKNFRGGWTEWARAFQLPSPRYIPFPPGGNFILTREKVHMYGRDLYDQMRRTMPYTREPGEAQLAERSYYLLWQ